MAKPKILFLDIETFPNVAYVWGKYEQNVIDYVQETCIASFAAKWQGGKVFAAGLPDYKGYEAGSYDDSVLVQELWDLLDEADIVVAHNGDEFDIKVIQGRFVTHGLTPPSPFKTVDTKKAAKKAGRFNSNSLNDLGRHFGLGKKIKTDFELWLGCIEGDQKSWDLMLKYNKQDVVLLEKVYTRLLPYITNHPIVCSGASCPKCGSTNIQFRGTTRTLTRVYRRFVCNDCGGWGRAVKSESSSEHTNIA